MVRIDEKRVEHCSEFSNDIGFFLTNVDAKICTSNSSNIEARLYGIEPIKNFSFYIEDLNNGKFRIEANCKESCHSAQCRVDIAIPRKTFKFFFIKGSLADITLDENVSIEKVQVKMDSGDFYSDAKVNNFLIEAKCSDIDLCIDATQNINIDASIGCGDTLIEFRNIGVINLSADSEKGYVKNRHKESKGYTADVNISTKIGDILIK